MRIRSIKYKSANKSSSHSELPERELNNSRIQAISTTNLQVNSHLHKQSTRVLKDNENSKTLSTTLQCSHFQENQQISTKRNNFFVSNSLDKNFTVKTVYERQKNILYDKENRQTYLRFKKNVMSKSPEGPLLKLRSDIKTDKIKLKVDNFKLNDQEIMVKDQQKIVQKVQESSQQQIDQIILGQNLTYNIDTLQKEILQIEEMTRIQKLKINRIRQQMDLFGLRMQGQLQDIVKSFRKGFQSLQCKLSRQKAQKCAQLINWKNVISVKRAEYEGYFESIDSLSQRSTTLELVINNKVVQFGQNQDEYDE